MAESGCNSRWVLFPGETMFEILRRLPLKSMLICKHVCKSWRSIISSPEFLNLYRLRWTRSSALLLLIRDRQAWFPELRYLLATLDPKTLHFEECLGVRKNMVYKVTQVINGLVCLISISRVRLFNLCTGETMTIPVNNYNSAVKFRFFFGFDPVSRAYKLVKVRFDSRECEIVTLGVDMCDASWKSIKVEYFPFKFEQEEAVCVDGMLYWLERDEKDGRVIAFDLNTHKFSTIFVPKVPDLSYFCRAALGFKGCLAFAYTSDSQFNILSLNRKSGWTTQTFELPTEMLNQCKNLTPFGCLPTGEIMLLVKTKASMDTQIYSYDPESQKFEGFEVDIFQSLILSDSACLSCFHANFNPLYLILEGR